MYRDGLGVKADDTKAVKYLLRAADRGNARAMWVLSEMYQQGRGVEKDAAKADEWSKLAVKNGYKGIDDILTE
jgi:TPR repeat protein